MYSVVKYIYTSDLFLDYLWLYIPNIKVALYSLNIHVKNRSVYNLMLIENFNINTAAPNMYTLYI